MDPDPHRNGANMTEPKLATRRTKSDPFSYMITVIDFYSRQTRLAAEERNLQAAHMFELGLLAIVICHHLGVDIERSAKSPSLKKSVRAIMKSTEGTIFPNRFSPRRQKGAQTKR